MSREETKMLIMGIVACYPNYKPADIKMTVDMWCLMLEDRSFNEMQLALKSYVLTNTSGFAPDIGQLIAKAEELKNGEQMSELGAWSLVSKAIRNSAYNATEEFNKFPADVQKAVGSPEILRAWGMDSNYNENVAQSHFINCYRQVVERRKKLQALPESVRNKISGNQADRIGVNDNV